MNSTGCLDGSLKEAARFLMSLFNESIAFLIGFHEFNKFSDRLANDLKRLLTGLLNEFGTCFNKCSMKSYG